jgi:ectoine hydroxylase-related dioxygenase (phytanoyl-CoA dioxygenase family)
VKPGDGEGSESGWRPHIDFCEVGDRLTVWVALSDATLTNGCMYLIPKTRVSDPVLDDFKNMRPIESNELRRLLHGSRALPVSAGTMLCWEHNVIHWGSQARPGSEPRISFSVVFLKKQAVPLDLDLPLLDVEIMPAFEERLRAIGRGILYYQVHHLVLLGRYAVLAERLLAELKNKEKFHDPAQG